MYIADANNAKRGPFTDAAAKHQMFYSPFHRDAALCGTGHDVSNPAFSLQRDGTYAPNRLDQPANVDNGDFDPRKMFPVEIPAGIEELDVDPGAAAFGIAARQLVAGFVDHPDAQDARDGRSRGQGGGPLQASPARASHRCPALPGSLHPATRRPALWG